ncbi:MAG: isopentenyl-diphosphate Delta-isomerase [Polyangia bacterium]|jgi:isopentenyl-diphosphate delta-isomerase|nr:isopentenyl-diphosphate Delta-isomerase [Polyangia bacterium]
MPHSNGPRDPAVAAPQVSFDDEPLILVDEEDRELGYSEKWECHRGEGLLHRAFSIFLFNGRGEVLLQQRSDEKPLWPLVWSNACCSHPRRGESLEGATRRRLLEELGVQTEIERVFSFSYHARWRDVGSERELCHVYLGTWDGEVEVNPREVAEIRWVSSADLDEEIARAPEDLSPWMKLEWSRLKEEHPDLLARYLAS